MDGSRNTLVSPVSIIPSANSKFSHSPGGLDENELCHDQINFSNMKSSQKSPSSTKHYMSPTISAASKAALPRKKILAERNEVPIIEQILFAKPFHISPKMPSPRCSTDSLISIKSCSSEPSIFDPKVSVKCLTKGLNQVQSLSAEPADDSSLKPYDPVTNYLSPRPQFLRYNPNRCHGISLHSENEAGEKVVVLDPKRGLSFDTQKPAFEGALGEDTKGSSVSYSDDDSGKEEDEITYSENAEEDTQDSSVFSSEEDNEGSSVFSSEEDPVKKENEKIFDENAENYPVREKEEEEEEEIEVYEDERGWSLKGVSQFLFVMVSLIFSTHYISTMNTPHLTFNPEAVWNLKSQSHKFHFDMGFNFTESVVEPTSLWGKTEIGLMKFDQGEITDGFEEEFVIRDDNQSLVDITYELFDMEVEAQEVETDKLGLPHIEAEEEEAHEDQVLESIDKASELVEVFEIEKPEEVSNEQQESEVAEMYENEKNSGLGSDGIERVEEISDQMVEEISDQVVEDNVERFKDTANNQVDKFDTGNVGSGSINQENDSMEFAFPKAKLDSIQSAAIIVTLMFTILASLGVVYYLRRKKVRIEESSPVVEPLVEEQPVLAENISPLPPTMEEEKSYGAKNLTSTSSLIRAAQEEVAAEIRHSHSHSNSQQSHAPIVELLGELVIGEVSSSRRSHTVRSSREQYSSMSVSQSQKGSFMEEEAAEVSNHHAKKKTTNLNLSVADSTTLDGSSTAEKKKRGKGAAEETPVRRLNKAALSSPSPVRRSSRLRDRSAMSP